LEEQCLTVTKLTYSWQDMEYDVVNCHNALFSQQSMISDETKKYENH